MTLNWLMERNSELHIRKSWRKLKEKMNGDTGILDLLNGRIQKATLISYLLNGCSGHVEKLLIINF